MLRRGLTRHAPAGPTRPSAVLVRRRRRRLCVVAALAVFIVFLFASGGAFLLRELRSVGGDRDTAPRGPAPAPGREVNDGNDNTVATHNHLPTRTDAPPTQIYANVREDDGNRGTNRPLRPDGDDVFEGGESTATTTTVGPLPSETPVPADTGEAEATATATTTEEPSTRNVEMSQAPRSVPPTLLPSSIPTVAPTWPASSSRAATATPSPVQNAFSTASPLQTRPSATATATATSVHVRLFPELRVTTTGDDDDDGDDGLARATKRVTGSVGADDTQQQQHQHHQDGKQVPVLSSRLTDPSSGWLSETEAAALRFASHDTVAPLHKVRVELLRQRVDRYTWWQQKDGRSRKQQQQQMQGGQRTRATATAAEEEELSEDAYSVPIVALRGPTLPTTHYFPREVLVEEYLSGDDEPNMYPDPHRFMPMHTRITTSSGGQDVERSEDVSLFTEEGRAAFSPVVRVVRDKRCSVAAACLRWHAGDPGDAVSAESFRNVGLSLFTVRPNRQRQVQMGGANQNAAVDGSNQQGNGVVANEGRDTSRTTSLAASLRLRGLRRLYGLPGCVASSARGAGAGSLELPIDGFHSVVQVAGRDAMDHSTAPGVMPLLFAELGGRDVHTRRREADNRSDNNGADGGLGRDHPRTVGVLWLSSAPFTVRTHTTRDSLSGTMQETAEATVGRNSTAVTMTTTVTLVGSAAETRLYLLPGPTHADVLRQYYTLTGFPTLPPLAALGYHHHIHNLGPLPLAPPATAGGKGSSSSASRAGTLQGALEAINDGFLACGVPVDSLGFTGAAANTRLLPFSWHAAAIPQPGALQTKLWLYGRRLYFARGSPHIPVVQSAPPYQEGRQNRYFVSEDPDDDTWYTAYPREAAAAFVGGAGGAGGEVADLRSFRSHLIDFANPSARRWFGGMLKYKRFLESTNHTFIALTATAPDALMAEGFTLPMTAGHHGGRAHRQLHNAYGLYYLMSAFHGLLRRSRYFRRAFVPTEHFFPGVHRFGGATFLLPSPGDHGGDSNVTATGDTSGGPVSSPDLSPAWRRLREAIESVAALGVSGIPFVGANAAGFEGDLLTAKSTRTTPFSTSAMGQAERAELAARWFQAASIFPFMRSEEGRGLSLTVAAALLPGVTRTAADEGTVVQQQSPQQQLYRPLPPSEARAQLIAAAGGSTTGATTAVKDAIRLRYALLPYLYTRAWHASLTGTPLLGQPQDLLSPARHPSPASTADGAICLHLGDTLIACPITANGRGAVDSITRRLLHVTLPFFHESHTRVVRGAAPFYYDLHRGKGYAAGSRVAVPTMISAKESDTWTWLGAVGTREGEQLNGEAYTATESTAETVSPLPLFQRAHTIVPAFTTFAPTPLWGSRTPSNVTLTIALAPGTRRSVEAQRQRELAAAAAGTPPADEEDAVMVLASGEMYWDGGSQNYQVPPPLSVLADANEGGTDKAAVGRGGGHRPEGGDSTGTATTTQHRIGERQRAALTQMRHSARFCHVKLSLLYAHGRLVLEGSPVVTDALADDAEENRERATGAAAKRCLAALREWAWDWNEIPESTATAYKRARAAAREQRHADEVARNAAAERGEARLRRRTTGIGEGEGGGEDDAEVLSPSRVLPAGALVRHTLASVLQVRHLRVFTASVEDAQWIREALSRSEALEVVGSAHTAAAGGGDEEEGPATTVVARVRPRIQVLGHRLTPAPDTVSSVTEEIRVWRLSFPVGSPP